MKYITAQNYLRSPLFALFFLLLVSTAIGQNITPGNADFYDYDFMDSTHGIVVAPDAIYRTDDRGDTWTVWQDSSAGMSGFALATGPTAAIVFYRGQLRLTSDYGQNWQTLASPQDSLYLHPAWMQILDDSTWYLGMRSTFDEPSAMRIYLSEDSATTWTDTGILTFQHSSSGFLPRSLRNQTYFLSRDIVLSPINAHPDSVIGGGNLVTERSTDGGLSWTPVPNFPLIGNISQTDNRLYLSANLYSTDQGLTWNNNSPAVAGSYSSTTYAMLDANTGVRASQCMRGPFINSEWTNDAFFTQDGWSGEQFFSNNICDQKYRIFSKNLLYTASATIVNTNEFIELTRSNPGSQAVYTPEPAAAQLHIYPNPAHQSATIVFETASGKPFADVLIRNVQGKLVKPPFQYRSGQRIDLNQLASGIYFVQIIVDGNTLTERLQILD